MWAFGTSRYGLGLTANELWALTPREFYALMQVWQDAHKPMQFYYAGIQASIHNAWLRGENQAAYSPYDWLPDEDRPQEKPKTVAESMLHNRLALFEAACSLAAAKQDAETSARVDVLAQRWEIN